MIVVGIDAHKKTHTASAIGAAVGEPLGNLTINTDQVGMEKLMTWARGKSPDRLWAVEDCRHVTGGLERFLIGLGETVVRVPTKLMAGSRKSTRTPGKSDAIDARAVAMAALREPNLPKATLAGPEREIRLLVDYRDQLVSERSVLQQRIRWHLHELCPDLQVPPRALDRGPWPGKVGRLLRKLESGTQVEITLAQLGRMNQLTKLVTGLEKRITALVKVQAPELLEIPGCGALTAGKILGEVAGVQRFSSASKLALHAGIAPLPVYSGQNQRHRLNRFGNRKLNCAIHRIAITQAGRNELGKAYMKRKQEEGKTKREALRCLKRHLIRLVFKVLRHVASRQQNEQIPSTGLT